MGDNSIAFVNKTLGYIATNPKFVPPFLNIDALKIDVAAVGQLSQIAGIAAQLSDNITDTLTMPAALIYYNSVKQAAKNSIPRTKTIFDDLSACFAMSSHAGKTPKPQSIVPSIKWLLFLLCQNPDAENHIPGFSFQSFG